jgi:hypothetical protein
MRKLKGVPEFIVGKAYAWRFLFVTVALNK